MTEIIIGTCIGLLLARFICGITGDFFYKSGFKAGEKVAELIERIK